MKNAVITGASKGLGKAIAMALAKEGYNIFMNSTNKNEIEAAANEIRNMNTSIVVTPIVADLSTKMGVNDFAAQITPSSIDVLVNNAGRYIPGKIYEEADDTLEKMINTNLYSAYYVTKALLPKMMPYKKGNIINICSVAALQPYANGGSYSISKYALQGFSKNLREEMKPFNIKVTSIHPGATWSHSWQGVDLPKDRLMEAEDVAKTVVAITQLSASAVMEDVVLRPQLGDL
jgi:short-subunit dehydrogenase